MRYEVCPILLDQMAITIFESDWETNILRFFDGRLPIKDNNYEYIAYVVFTIIPELTNKVTPTI